MFAALARMANLWLCTMDSMNSEDHSEVFVDVNDQWDWSVTDDSVEAFMQLRFRVSSMTDDEVQRNLSILPRRYSPDADDSSATLGVLLSFPARIPVSVLHHIHHLCRCLLRWIPLPHNFWLCHPRTGLKLYHLFV